MTFDDLQSGDRVFIDANIFIYHFSGHARDLIDKNSDK